MKSIVSGVVVSFIFPAACRPIINRTNVLVKGETGGIFPSTHRFKPISSYNIHALYLPSPFRVSYDFLPSL
jgi:hypothetical protein